MRRRRHLRSEAGAARGIETDAAGGEVGAQVGGEVAGRAVVGGDQQRRAGGEAAIVLEQRREQQRAQHRRGGDLDRLAAGGGLAHAPGERVDALVLGGDLEKGTKAHGQAKGPDGLVRAMPRFYEAGAGAYTPGGHRLKLRSTAEGAIAEDRQRGRWVLAPAADDLLALLAGGEEARRRSSARSKPAMPP